MQKRAVIDTGVVHAISLLQPPSIPCLELLDSLEAQGDVLIVVCPELWREYERHSEQYFLTWFAALDSNQRVEHRVWSRTQKRGTCKRLLLLPGPDRGQKKAVAKDMHLLYLAQEAQAMVYTREAKLPATYSAQSTLGNHLRSEYGQIKFQRI